MSVAGVVLYAQDWPRFLAAAMSLSPEPLELSLGQVSAPEIATGDHVYIAAHARLRCRVTFERVVRTGDAAWSLRVTRGSAQGVTLSSRVAEFRGWKAPWWEAEHEVDFLAWQIDALPKKIVERIAKASATSSARAAKARPAARRAAPAPGAALPAVPPAPGSDPGDDFDSSEAVWPGDYVQVQGKSSGRWGGSKPTADAKPRELTPKEQRVLAQEGILLLPGGGTFEVNPAPYEVKNARRCPDCDEVKVLRTDRRLEIYTCGACGETFSLQFLLCWPNGRPRFNTDQGDQKGTEDA